MRASLTITQAANPAVYFITHTGNGSTVFANTSANTVRLRRVSGRFDWARYNANGTVHGTGLRHNGGLDIQAGRRLAISLSEGYASATFYIPWELRTAITITQAANPAVYFITHTGRGNMTFTNTSASTVRLRQVSGRFDWRRYNANGTVHGSGSRHNGGLDIQAGRRLVITLSEGYASVTFYIPWELRTSVRMS